MKKINTILVVIILLAIFLRAFRIDSVPPGLFGDELDVGYQAYSILKTGRDLTGHFMPFYIKSLSEYRTPLYLYSAVPFIGIFGLNEYGVRLPAVFWGIVSILGIYLLTKKLFNQTTALLASFITSISPWHLQYSRASFEVTMLISFIIFGVYFFLLGLEKNRYLFITATLFALSIYIYSTAVVFIPLFSLLLLGIYFKQITKIKLKNISLIILTGLIFLIPFFISMFTGIAKERFSSISIFQDSVLLDKINRSRQGMEFFAPEGSSVKTNPLAEKVFINKATIFTQVFITNYFASLSPIFLFTEGDINFRQSIHEMGELYYFEAILLILGMFVLVKFDWKKSALIFGWILIAPIPSSLTFDGGHHATRLFILLPPLIILSAVGGNWLLESRKKLIPKLLLVSVSLLVVLNISFYMYRYYVHYGPESWRWWHIGFKEAMQYMDSIDENYRYVGFNDTYEPSLIRYLFWNKVDPATFQADYAKGLTPKELFPEYNGFFLNDKYFFGSTQGALYQILPTGTLYMVSARDEVPGNWDWAKDPPTEFKVLKTIRNPLNEPIFYVVAKE